MALSTIGCPTSSKLRDIIHVSGSRSACFVQVVAVNWMFSMSNWVFFVCSCDNFA